MSVRCRSTCAFLVAGLAAATLAACSSGGHVRVAAGAASGASGTVSLQELQRGLQKLDGIVSADLKATTIPGVAVGVVYQGRLVYAKGFGVRKVGAPGEIDADTVFQLASVSKPISSSVLSAAVTQHKLSWDDPVRRGLPSFTLGDSLVSSHVTLADMFSHRSGLPEHTGDLLEDLGYSQRTIFGKLRLEPLGPFRLQYAYTNYGLTAAGESAARAQGESFEQLAQQEIFRPLGMTSTSTTFAELQQRTDRAALHEKVGGSWQPNLLFDVDRQAPAGGLSSSVNDLSKWVTMLLDQGKFRGKQIVSPAQLLRTWQPQSIRGPSTHIGDPSTFYGLGWNLGNGRNNELVVDHSGAFATGAGTNVLLVPTAKLGIISLTNGSPIGLPESINRAFLDEVEVGHQTQDWLTLYRNAFAGLEPTSSPFDKPPPVVTASRAVSQYVGTYTSAYWGPLTVTAGNGELSFRIGPQAMQFRLTHYTGDTFFFTTRGESATGKAGALFRGPPGRARTVTIDAWNTTGLGTFTRRS